MKNDDRRRLPPSPVVSLPPNSRTPADYNAAEILLAIEDQARQAPDVASLRHLIVNEPRKLNRARQIFLVETGARGRMCTSALSGVGTFDPTSALIQDAARLMTNAQAQGSDLTKPFQFSLPAFAQTTTDLAHSYPFREFAWVPLLRRDGSMIAGMLAARESVWSNDDLAVTRRMASAFSHAWESLAPQPWWAHALPRLVRWRTPIVAAIAIAMAMPFPLTALAPAEIVARDPEVVAAPLDGVIDKIDVSPSAPVKKGDVLVRYADTVLRNKREIALQEVAVAEARLKQSTLLAFSDAKGRQELGISQAELELKRAELAFATAQLERGVVRSGRDGIAVFPDRRSLIGKPVSTGERLMEIADPARIEVRIDIAMPDAITLGREATVRLFLDVEPLSPRIGRIVRSDYKARPSDADVMSFRAFAHLDGDSTPPRLGLRGTAQVSGDSAPLAFVILRRPISAMRQWLGW